MLNKNILLAQDMGLFYKDLLGFIMYSFPWESDHTIQKIELEPELQEKYGVQYGPSRWVIDWIQNHGLDNALEAGKYPLKFSTSSGHGIGKSCLVAWLILWIMSTRPQCNGVVTAGTIEQLRSKTWSELHKWYLICKTRDWFNISSGRGNLAIRHKEYPENWKCIAQTAKEENSESFAGLHAASSTPFYIFDEASQIPEAIWDVREGGLTDGESMTFDFGNPTRNSGRFFENTVGRFSKNYITRSIDSRDVEITNKDIFEQWRLDRGEDSDFFKVRVKGVFPSQGYKQFINSDEVQACMDQPDKEDRTAPLVIGVDIARFGDDDTVIYPRLGRDARSFEPVLLSGHDTVQVTGRVIEMIREFRVLGLEVAGLFVDGGGVGGGVVDQLRHLGYNPIEVLAQHKCTHPEQYRYKSDEIWGDMKEWIRNIGVLPPRNTDIGTRLYSELTQREYEYTLKGQINLESKSDMKDRGIESPNIADALSLTFSQHVGPAVKGDRAKARSYVYEYDPLGPVQDPVQPGIINGRYS